MARNTVGWKFESTFFGRTQEVVPATRIEVVPGDSVEGSIEVNFRSDVLQRPVAHSAMIEYALFYCPNRIANSNWPDFITGNGGSIGSTTSAAARFFENNVTPTPKNTLYRSAYGAVFNEHIRDPEDAEWALSATPAVAPRLRDYSSIIRESAADTATIDTSGASVTARAVRAAMAEDRWNARRAMYGDKFSDYLRALGIDAYSMLIEKPEKLGSVSKRLKTAVTADTTATTTGTPAANFLGNLKLNLRRKSFAEHGFLVGVLCFRPRIVLRKGNPPDALKQDVEDFWSPEFEAEGPIAVPNAVLEGDQAGSDGYLPKFSEYRQPMDMYFPPAASPATEYTMSIDPPTFSIANFRNITPSDFNGYFRNTIGASYHYVANAWHNLAIHRPVSRAAAGT